MRRLLLLTSVAACVACAQKPDIQWSFGPATLDLTPTLRQSIQPEWIYARGPEMQRFLKATGNQLSGSELAVIGARDLSWFAILSSIQAARDAAFEEDSTEPDGRQVLILTRVSALGLQYELLTERQNEQKARAAANALFSGLAATPALQWQPLAALFIFAALGFWLYRQRGL